MPKNVRLLKEKIRDCTLCPRCCHVDRTAGKLGACQIGELAIVASSDPHFGEEPILVGHGGSGTIFFCGCNLHCLFCQNYNISHYINGNPVSADELAAMAISLQDRGCENINFVTPTHVTHAVAEAIVLARSNGLSVPIVYNCGGYESVQTLQLLEGLIEIYMPDFKYADPAAGWKYSGARDYPQVVEAALAEMYRQAGPIELDDRDLAKRGVLVRHLVMPQDVARSKEVVDIVSRVAPGGAINILAQYRPAFRASQFSELMYSIDYQAVKQLRDHATRSGLVCVDH